MRVLALEYHDVVGNDAWDTTGFSGVAARSYKLANDDFDHHLRTIDSAACDVAANVLTIIPGNAAGARGVVLFTFDDGGVSAYTEIAPRLERYGWRGHFFMPTDFIGARGFLNAHQLRDLHQRGHCIGTH